MSNPLVKPKKIHRANPLRQPSRPVKKTTKPNVQTTNNVKKALPPKELNSKPSGLLGSSSSSNTPARDYTDFTLSACSSEDIRDLRYHIMRFHAPRQRSGERQVIDPSQFTKPIRLHRKDPRNMQNQLTLQEIEERNKRLGITTAIPKDAFNSEEQANNKAGILTDAEGDVEMKPAENTSPTPDAPNVKEEDKANGTTKPAGQEVDLSLIAPDGGARRSKANPFQKKTRQVIVGDPNAKKLRYEEYYPWVLEDFDGKNTWIGNYEAGQTDAYVLFVLDGRGGFKMVPAEKWYKMTPRNKFPTLTAEEVEKQMAKGEQTDRWVMKYFGNDEEKAQKPINMRRRFRTTDNAVGEDGRRPDEDENDIDYEEEFDDDEGAPLMDGNEEEVKEAEKKIKREQQNAKISSLFQEPDDDEDDEQNQKVDKQGRHMLKYLRSREKNVNYDTDDDENPYASEESSEEEEEITTAPPIGEAVNGSTGEQASADTTNSSGNASNGIKTEPDSNPLSQTSPSSPSNGLNNDKAKKDKKLKGKKSKKDKKKKGASKRHMDLPAGMVILNLPPRSLAEFPPNLWNPNLKRRRAEVSEGEEVARGPKTKKVKLKASTSTPTTETNTPPVTAKDTSKSLGSSVDSKPDVPSTTTTPSSKPFNSENLPDLLQEEEVVSIIQARPVSAKELLAELRSRLKMHRDNPNRLKRFVKHVAKLHDGHLVIRDR